MRPAERASKLVSHPLRPRIVEAIGEGRRSPQNVAQELGEPLGVVSYHVRELVKLGILVPDGERPVRGAVEHFYRVSDYPAAKQVIDIIMNFG